LGAAGRRLLRWRGLYWRALRWRALCGPLLCGPLLWAPALAQGGPSPGGEAEYVALQGQGYGLLRRPPADVGPARVGVLVMHPTVSSLDHPACRRLSLAGYATLCGDPWTVNRPFGYGGYEAQAQAVRAGVERLRAEPGVVQVVLLGHGAGAPMMAFYQAVALNGPAACQGPRAIAPCDPAGLAGLPAADALALLDPELGQAFELLGALDPAIVAESSPAQRDPALDMYAPRNGFDPGRNAGEYPPAFRKAFFAAQAARATRLLEDARRLSALIAARDSEALADDMPFFVAGATSARLWQADLRLLARTRAPHVLVGEDGGRTRRTLVSTSPPTVAPREAGSFRAAAQLSVKRFLAGYAILATPEYEITADEVKGVVWDSSPTSAVANVAGVRTPLFVAAMAARPHLRPAEMIFDAAATPAAEKEFLAFEGPGHALTACGHCPGAGPAVEVQRRVFERLHGFLAARLPARPGAPSPP
jgi:hypothetical protein